MGKSMKYAGRVVCGVPFFFERLPVTGRIALPAIQLLERENVMLRMALAECESGGADNDSQDGSESQLQKLFQEDSNGPE
jgi:hypothetical protein